MAYEKLINRLETESLNEKTVDVNNRLWVIDRNVSGFIITCSINGRSIRAFFNPEDNTLRIADLTNTPFITTRNSKAIHVPEGCDIIALLDLIIETAKKIHC